MATSGHGFASIDDDGFDGFFACHSQILRAFEEMKQKLSTAVGELYQIVSSG